MLNSLKMYDELVESKLTEKQAKAIIDVLEIFEKDNSNKISTTPEFITISSVLIQLKEHISYVEKLIYFGFGLSFAALSYLIFIK